MLTGQGPVVVYSIVYIVSGIPWVIVPVNASIIAKSPATGNGLKLKTPPVSPVIVAVAPSHVAVKVKLASSKAKTVTPIFVFDGQGPEIA